MSIIPYGGPDESRSVVLHDPVKGAFVLLDENSRQLSLHRDLLTTPIHSSFNDPRRPVFHDEICQYCGRSRPAVPRDSERSNSASSEWARLTLPPLSAVAGRTFVDRDYFKLLNDMSEPDVSDHVPKKSEISSAAYSHGYFERFFVTESELGRGGRGAVYLVEHVLDGVSLGKFACKKVPVGNDHEWLARVLREVDLLRLTHPNLVNYNHVWLENAQLFTFGPSVPCIFILQEYCNGGTLEDYVLKRRDMSLPATPISRMRSRKSSQKPDVISNSKPKFLTPDEIGSFFLDITSGLSHLHHHGFVHRDLKPSNCLLSLAPESLGGIPRVLVSDFGEGQRAGAKREATGATGTVEYSAPETLAVDSSSGSLTEFSFKTDMFSLGMILYFLCFSKLPYHHDFDSEFEELKQEVMDWEGFNISQVCNMRNDLPTELYQLLSRLLSLDPNERLTAEEILDLNGASINRQKRSSSSSSSTRFNGVFVRKEANDVANQRVDGIVGTSKSVNNGQLTSFSWPRSEARRRSLPESKSYLKHLYTSSKASAQDLDSSNIPSSNPQFTRRRFGIELGFWRIIGSYILVAALASYVTIIMVTKKSQ
ncbi:kinase-like domain-containing protein [Lipomyces japonicus]|uniref:kinase-like domain-containing protein n=1 Tax=Lipomyces japonicus TaxID=56871 RepID=UPI0034CFAC12